MADVPEPAPGPTRREILGAAALAGAALSASSLAASAAPAEAAPPAAAPAAAPPAAPRIEIVCRQCGGNAVARDAWAEWDVATQAWVLGAVFDYAYCHDCDGEAKLDEVDADSFEESR
jgi:hypothetical protein